MVVEVFGSGADGSGTMECHASPWFWKWAGRGRLRLESSEMQRILDIFMSLEVQGRGASGLRIIRNAYNCVHFHGFGRRREGGVWLQNHKKRIGLSALSWFWKLAGGGRLAS